jgi:hypothetical protein
VLPVAENGGRAAILQQLGDLIVVQGRVERHDGATRSNDPEISGDPARMIVGQDSQA